MAAVNGSTPHVLAFPIPGQGHVKPLMSLCRQIAQHGVKVTFVNAQSVHDKIVSAAKFSRGVDEEEEEQNQDMVLVTVPDELALDPDPNNCSALMEALTDLIDRINSSNPDRRVSCVIADTSLGRIFDIAVKMGAKPIGFSPPSLASLAMLLHIPKLLEEGTLGSDGSLKKGDAISLSEDIPSWRREGLPWSVPGDPKATKGIFDFLKIYRDVHKAEWILSNSCYELEPAASELLPGILPVGPLHLLDSDAAATTFLREDSSCVRWLDDKPDGSVIYVSFGSVEVFSQQQLDEMALGLELSGRAFLWVNRPGLANESRAMYPDGFLERVGEIAKIVEWVPQDKILSHPSIGCFISHCGWNSVLEGVSRGVPFLCWSKSVDQLHNDRYICDKWEIGLKINFDEGVPSKHDIKMKIDTIFSGYKFKENALKLKEICGRSVCEGGSSYNYLLKFIDYLRK